MKALIDADNVAIAAAWTAENEDEPIATSRANEFLERLLADCGASSYELWLSGGKNFRYSVYPEYKANRFGKPRPRHEAAVKQFMTEQWQANWTDGIEADDMLGIRQCESEDTIIVHLDKDLDQIYGEHYTWELKRLGEVVKPARRYFVDPYEADYHFFYQMLIGDPTDNIKGVVGIGPKKAKAILDCFPEECYHRVLEQYASEEEFDMNAQCLYIWRKHNDNWRNILSTGQTQE